MVLKILQISKSINESSKFNSLIYIFTVSNLLDNDGHKEVWIFLRTIIDGGVKKILIDMEKLEFIDSMGINILINAAKLIRSNNGELALVNIPDRIETIFSPINLQRFINMFKSNEDAIKFFRLQ